MRKISFAIPAIKRGAVLAAVAIPFMFTLSAPSGITLGVSEASAEEARPPTPFERVHQSIGRAFERGYSDAGRAHDRLGEAGQRLSWGFHRLQPWGHGGGGWGHGGDPWDDDRPNPE